MNGMDGQTTAEGFVLDRCHDQVGLGDVFVGEYRGRTDERFIVLSDDGRGMFRFRDPDGVERPMRPSTMLAGVAAGRHRHERASAERRAIFTAVAYMRANDCDFLTAANVADYSHEPEEACRAVLLEMGYSAELVG